MIYDILDHNLIFVECSNTYKQSDNKDKNKKTIKRIDHNKLNNNIKNVNFELSSISDINVI